MQCIALSLQLSSTLDIQIDVSELVLLQTIDTALTIVQLFYNPLQSPWWCADSALCITAHWMAVWLTKLDGASVVIRGWYNFIKYQFKLTYTNDLQLRICNVLKIHISFWTGSFWYTLYSMSRILEMLLGMPLKSYISNVELRQDIHN